jgi:hypothetical protein
MERREENQQERYRHVERAPNTARTIFGEPVDVRLATIHDTLDQARQRGVSTWSARMALVQIADELGGRVGNEHEYVRPSRAD